MLKDEAVEIAYWAGFSIIDGIVTGGATDLNRFAELIESKVEERYKWDGIHSCGPTCTKLACVATREAVVTEREACAKRAEIALLGTLKTTSDRVLKAIRNTSRL